MGIGVSSKTVTCQACSKTAERDDGRLPEPWCWRYTHAYGDRFIPQRDWERYYFCSETCVAPYDREMQGTGYA